MKRNKVLLGLYVGLLTLAGGVANAQTNSRFYEVGPDNIGGQVSSFVLDRQDTNRTTIREVFHTMQQLNPEARYSVWNALEADERLIEY
jgi:hypothetical protein